MSHLKWKVPLFEQKHFWVFDWGKVFGASVLWVLSVPACDWLLDLAIESVIKNCNFHF